MKAYSNAQSMANRILMLRNRLTVCFLLVEGDTDVRFYSSLVDNRTCKIMPADGRHNVVETLSELERRGAKGASGIVDADYYVLEGHPSSANLFTTDSHDIETMILVSPALEKVLRELVPSDRLGDVERIAEEVRDALVQIGTPVGILRWVSFRDHLDLNFRDLPFHEFIDAKALVVDRRRLIRCVRTVAGARKLPTDNDCERRVSALEERKADPWHVCQGHDLVCMLELVLPVVFERRVGRKEAEKVRNKVHASVLDKDLRLAYEPRFFAGTRLCDTIQAWEQANGPFKILAVN
ncbi:MAG: DUF4435 domain-containing protein [Anaerolineae bacterium]